MFAVGATPECSVNPPAGQDGWSHITEAESLQKTRNRDAKIQNFGLSMICEVAISEQATGKLFAYFPSITVLRGLAAECMLKAIAFARAGRFERGHNLSALYEALDGATKGFIEKTADSHGVASPRRILKRHKDDFVAWRYPAGEEQHSDLLDLDRTLSVLDSVYRQIVNGNGP